jgi:AAA domain
VTQVRRESRIVEVVGVAGSGKSTLARVLRTSYGWQVADSLHTRTRAHWPYVAHGLPGLLPLVAASARERPLLSWDELKLIVYVAEWHRFLRAKGPRWSKTVVLDQGPIFGLACLLWGRKPSTRSERFEEWLRRMVERWSLELYAIVLLEAPDETLLARIDGRERYHEAKGLPVDAGLEVVARHRAAYARVLSLSESLGGPRVLHYDTSARSTAEIAAELVQATTEPRRAAESAEAPHSSDAVGTLVGDERLGPS